MGMFDLPTGWVFVEYEDGTRENVANTDVLDENFARGFVKMWGKEKKIVRVVLERDNKIVKAFDIE